MTHTPWEKPELTPERARLVGRRTARWQYLVGGLLILGAVAYLLVSGTLTGARFFITVQEVLSDPQYVGQQVRVTGAVIGDTITYDAEQLLITFTVAHMPEATDDLAETLRLAVNNPSAMRMSVRVENQVKPELLQHEAQAIMTGYLDADGVFHVSELNLKCPSRFIEGQPDQSLAQPAV